MIKIAVIPIDNRPICYDFVKQIGCINNDISIKLPPIEFMASLYTEGNSERIIHWLEESSEEFDYIIVSLDTIAYGGLINSRRYTILQDSFEKIKMKIEYFFEIARKKRAKIFAFSSIMRISNNNINVEENSYWDEFGVKIFEHSFNYHKNKNILSYDFEKNIKIFSSKIIPNAVLKDYLERRRINFEINKVYLQYLKEGFIEKLVFSKDDCAQYGLNILEAQALEKNIKELGLDNSAVVKNGADEIAHVLLSACVLDVRKKERKISVGAIFINDRAKDKISRYEDESVLSSLISQVKLCGLEFEEDVHKADMLIIVNNFSTSQGELVMGIRNKSSGYVIGEDIRNKPYCIADILNANGADVEFCMRNIKIIANDRNFCGYSGWNTTSNSFGTALSVMCVKKISLEEGSKYNDYNFRISQLVRFLDDYVYQGIVRERLVKELVLDRKNCLNELNREMRLFERDISDILKLDEKVFYTLPWNRSFEIKVEIEEK